MVNKTKNNPSRSSIIHNVKTLLGFFTLVVLICEATLGLALSKADEDTSKILVVGMILVLMLLIISVTLIAIYKPSIIIGKLSKDEEQQQPDTGQENTATTKTTSESSHYKAELKSDDKYLSYATGKWLSLFYTKDLPVRKHSNNKKKFHNQIRNLCNKAYWESGVHPIISSLIHEPFGAYVLVYMGGISVSVAIYEETRNEYLINQSVGRTVENNIVEEDIEESENNDSRFGQWLLKEPPEISGIPPLGVLAILNKSGFQFQDLNEIFDFHNFSSINSPLVYAIDVPGKCDLYSMKNGDLPLRESIGIKVVEDSSPGGSFYRDALIDFANAVKTIDYYGQDKEINEVFFIPVLCAPRINLLLMPTKKAGRKIPRNLAGLFLLRRCAELLHSKFVESLSLEGII